MPTNVKHQFVSGKADDADATLIRPSNWNDEHVGALEVMDRDLDEVEIVNDSAETSIYSHSIPADQMGGTGGFRLIIGGDYLNDSGSSRSLTIKVKLGATTALTSAAMSIPDVATNRRKWFLEVVCLNSATDAQKWLVRWTIGPSNAANFATENPGTASGGDGAGYGTSAEDTTGALTLDVTMDHGAAHASLSVRKEIAILEELPAA